MSGPDSPTSDPPTGQPIRVRLLMIPPAWVAVFLLGLGLGWWLEVSRPVEAADLDHRVWSWVVEHRDSYPVLTGFFRLATRLGDAVVAVPLIMGVWYGLQLLGRKRVGNLGRWDGLFFVGMMLGARLLVLALKALFDRERPLELHRLVSESSASFPSSHALNASAFCTLAAIFLGRAFRTMRGRSWWRWAVVAACPALALIIAASRVWLAVHYLSDVLIGLALGLVWILAASALYFGWPGRAVDRDA